MVLLFPPANVITISICLNKDYVWALYLLNMIEDSLVCQSTLISCSSVRSVMNILRRWTHSFMYSNVNNVKNLLVDNLTNYGNNYLTLPSTPKGATIWISIPSCVIRCRPLPGHSFRPYTEKELPFPVFNEIFFYTPNLIWCPYIAFYFNAYLTGALKILSSSISNHSDHEVPILKETRF